MGNLQEARGGEEVVTQDASLEAGGGTNRLTKPAQATRGRKNDGSTLANLPAGDTPRVSLRSPVRANRTPGSVSGAPGNRCPYLDISQCSVTRLTMLVSAWQARAIPQLLRTRVWAIMPLGMRSPTIVFTLRGLSPNQFTPMPGAPMRATEWRAPRRLLAIQESSRVRHRSAELLVAMPSS